MSEPAAKRLVISCEGREIRVALLEGGRVAELYVERPGSPSLVGNIYKGRVENVLVGMDAAFVDIGLGRNGFLYIEEAGGPDRRGRASKKITELVRGGQEVLVQVARDAMGGKGPRLTTQIGLVGRCLVYLPGSNGVGVSRRLDEPERDRLRTVSGTLGLAKGEGAIVRTAAEGGDAHALGREARFLRRQWAFVEKRAGQCKAPALVHAEPKLPLRSVRDLLGAEFGMVVVDDPGWHRRVVNYLRAIAPEQAAKVELDERGGLFERYGLEAEIAKALARRVELPSGGYIVIDHPEAMTVIDVNTGSYTGRRVLEDTIVKTNIEACREVVRQLRLRDIGGIIVIDFIDMAVPANREAVLQTMQDELAKDRTKSYVVEISPLGLVEMTRQNVTRGLREEVTSPCPRCGGGGRVISEDSALVEVERGIGRLCRGAALPVVRVEVHPRVAARLAACAGDSARTILECLADQTGVRVEVVPASRDAPLDHLREVPD